MLKKQQFNQLNINKLSNLDWKPISSKIFENYEVTTVWKIKIDSVLPHIEDLKDFLLPAESEKVMRYKQVNDQNQRIISKAVLRILLSRYTGIEAKSIIFTTDLNKKPIIESSISKPVHFNAAHSGNYVLISISAHPTGIDVEQINTVFSYQNLLGYSFTNTEADFIENSVFPHQTFFELWTRKEALLKATGKGLDDDLAKIPSLTGVYQISNKIINSNENWQISSFQIDENHVASVAFLPIKTALQFINFQL